MLIKLSPYAPLPGSDEHLSLVILRFPLAADASAAARFPEPLLIEADGPVELPR
ncbi:hypothetical protein [Pseudomonas aeruginosa]|uniref:hypothetical protein n=1 Tax=Pseudomonas aeruginosa TaxID=287 RepID=UPI001913BD42|nr:hypothetical protein [Pseudomonas aeruginosa]